MNLGQTPNTAEMELLHWDDPDGGPANQMGSILSQLIAGSTQVDVLTGFFYFNGIPEVADALDKKAAARKPFTMRILVGMEAEIGTRAFARELLEYGARPDSTPEQRKQRYARTLLEILRTTPSADKTNSDGRLYRRFVDMLQDGTVKLEIRQTKRPNHGKLYLFHPEDSAASKSYILGSSNFSKQGLKERHELNLRVEQDRERADRLSVAYNNLWDHGSYDIIEVKPRVGSPEDEPPCVTPAVLAAHSPYERPTPFQAYMALMKRYLGESTVDTELAKAFENALTAAGYQPLKYQLTGAAKAIKILRHHGGVIVADAVGLGKSVTAALIATQAHPGGGVIIVPATLVGEWTSEYLKKFGLDAPGRPWAVYSMTDLAAAESFCGKNAIGMVIVDEAHRFRNPKIQEYETLRRICHGRRVVLLTATPFNNAPSDLAALVGLFDARAERLHGAEAQSVYEHIVKQDARYRELVFLQRNWDRRSPPPSVKIQLRKLQDKYEGIREKKDISSDLRRIGDDLLERLRPYLIRRNRSDLRGNTEYHEKGGPIRMPKQEVAGRYYAMSGPQKEAYLAVLSAFEHSSNPDGPASTGFACTIYRASEFAEGEDVGNYLDNYRSMVLRHLLRRFESSPYAFRCSVQDLIRRHKEALESLEDSTKLYFNPKGLDLTDDDEGDESSGGLAVKAYCRAGASVAGIRFGLGEDERFMSGLRSDLTSLEALRKHADVLVQGDAKLALLKEIISPCVAQRRGQPDPLGERGAEAAQIQGLPDGAPRRIVVFTMFVDTARHLAHELARAYGSSEVMLAVDSQAAPQGMLDLGHVAVVHTAQEVTPCFDVKATNANVWTAPRILITTDKFSEGVNLNRAGLLVNYDIPWNPVRVIQRLGRINRINACWFPDIYVYNLYPEAHSPATHDASRHDWASAKDIAAQKLILIHQLFFEDATILGDSAAGSERPFEALDEAASADSEPPSEETQVRQQYVEALRTTVDSQAFEKRLLDFGMGMKTVRLGQAKANMVIFRQTGAQIRAWILDELHTADLDKRTRPVTSLLDALEMVASVPGDQGPEPERFPDNYEEVEQRMATSPSAIMGNSHGQKTNTSQTRALAALEAWKKRPDLQQLLGKLVSLCQTCDSHGLAAGQVAQIAKAGGFASRRDIEAVLDAAPLSNAIVTPGLPGESETLIRETILTFVNEA